ncbi:GAF domain-containing protein [Nocardioides sp. HDW12B]|uniref:GAF domain-containing protein n=1 Tax=Nocardioides sp. HDW12B TaxID=2714939 RepID=UPI001409E5F0|nr:GAF domain-containing protein [Nocardioides sp. HDW12B]QIK65849.1 GAF domain-containing protein [Nocardioides sp. HDW12B]
MTTDGTPPTGAPDPDDIGLAARLGDALGTAVRPDNLERELRAATSGIREAFGAAACSFAQVQPDGATLRFAAADGAGAEEIVGVSLPVSRGIVGWVAMSGEPIQVADVASDKRFARDVAESTHYVPTTIMAAPVLDAHGDIAGVVEVLDPAEAPAGGPARDSGRDLTILGLLAAQLGSIIRLSALYDALGTGLLRTLADPEAGGAFDEALAAVSDPEAGVALQGVAEAFHDLAAAGPAAARMAERVLSEVASYVSQTAHQPGRAGGRSSRTSGRPRP